MKRVATLIVCGVLLFYAAVTITVFISQRGMMYFPSLSKPPIERSQIAGIQEISVKTNDGIEIYGWYAAPSMPGKPTIIRFHGNASNVGWAADRLKPFADAGYGVLLAEYRGYAGNAGKPTEQGFYNDGKAFIDWLKAAGVQERDIIISGESIGSGVAVQMALDYPDIHTLILEAPFTSTVDVATDLYWFLPVRLMMLDRYDNLSKIDRVQSPLIVAHGDRDTLIPYAHGKRLFEAATGTKSMITVEGADHNDLDGYGTDAKIIDQLKAWEQ